MRVQSLAEVQKAEQDQYAAAAKAKAALTVDDATTTNLSNYIQTRYTIMSNHRNSQSGWSERLLAAMRAFNGVYAADKLAQIRQFGGSEVYARLIAMKCRGATSLLRDVYISPDRPWGLEPPADPDIPEQIAASIKQLVMAEAESMGAMGGGGVDPDQLRDRVTMLMNAARDAAKERAHKQAKIAEDKLEELLQEGNFYKALAEFLVDLPMFPIACIKGPNVRVVPSVDWSSGQAVVKQTPKLFWYRVSPFDVYVTPGVNDVEDAEVIERCRLTRADLNDLLDLPGYDQDAIRAVLDEYGRGGLMDNWDTTDSERAVMESRENPHTNQSGIINCLEYHGNVQGRFLLEQGMDPSLIQDPLRDYMVQAWKIGRYIIKVQLSPSPRKRHPYFITSYEKVPGTMIGNALPDLLADIADVANATLRSLVNNLSISSGPQVVINTDRMAQGENPEQMYPWKRWLMESDPMGNNTQPPVSFFQPVSNAQELLQVYQAFNNLADEISALPRYQTGSGASGGAGRTASGLSMLMSNASKMLQTVAANVDRDVMQPLLGNLFDLLMLTDTSGFLTGQEKVVVRGVNVAVQRETQRARQLEFLQITANPLDAQIVGPKGRAKVLRQVSQGLGLDGEDIVPDPDHMPAAVPPNPATMGQDGGEAAGSQPPAATQDMGPRARIAGGVQ